MHLAIMVGGVVGGLFGWFMATLSPPVAILMASQSHLEMYQIMCAVIGAAVGAVVLGHLHKLTRSPDDGNSTKKGPTINGL
jgi:hypothetical protein